MDGTNMQNIALANSKQAKDFYNYKTQKKDSIMDLLYTTKDISPSASVAGTLIVRAREYI
jgi:hypothetical protein